MNVNRSCFIFSIIISSLYTNLVYAEFSFKTVCAAFGANPYQEIIDQEYSITPGNTLHVFNDHGNISIKTEWKRDTVKLKAIKRTNKSEYLKHLAILDTLTIDEDNTRLALSTVRENNNIRGSIDYELIIPAHINLILETRKGSISVYEISGPLQATTYQGDISVEKTSNTIKAETKYKGSISINQAQGDIIAQSHIGNITIHHATSSVVAKTNKGTIQTLCSQLPAASNINLATLQGPIELILPNKVNAKISGKTDRGTLTSSYAMTLRPMTTTLDNRAWSRFKKEVEGTIGSGDAHIKLNSARGNIKIVQAQRSTRKK